MSSPRTRSSLGRGRWLGWARKPEREGGRGKGELWTGTFGTAHLGPARHPLPSQGPRDREELAFSRWGVLLADRNTGSPAPEHPLHPSSQTCARVTSFLDSALASQMRC